jgi:hypothetical protein
MAAHSTFTIFLNFSPSESWVPLFKKIQKYWATPENLPNQFIFVLKVDQDNLNRITKLTGCRIKKHKALQKKIIFQKLQKNLF